MNDRFIRFVFSKKAAALYILIFSVGLLFIFWGRTISSAICFIILFALSAAVFLRMRKSLENDALWMGLMKETAHQLGTPVTSLSGWTEIIKMHLKEGSPPELISAAGEIEEDTKKLERIVKRFRQVGYRPEIREFNIEETIRETIRYYKDRIRQRKIEVSAEFEDMPDIYGNPELCGWVFENLLKNSSDAIEHDEGRIIIKGQYLNDNRTVKITYEDNGSGISREKSQHIFSPGFTTKSKGWGLGLALARRIVEDYHGGSIALMNPGSDEGACFVTYFPEKSGTKV
ncbi:MAG: sensor histidine kinase [Fibrobacterota bacterium]